MKVKPVDHGETRSNFPFLRDYSLVPQEPAPVSLQAPHSKFHPESRIVRFFDDWPVLQDPRRTNRQAKYRSLPDSPLNISFSIIEAKGVWFKPPGINPEHTWCVPG